MKWMSMLFWELQRFRPHNLSRRIVVNHVEWEAVWSIIPILCAFANEFDASQSYYISYTIINLFMKYRYTIKYNHKSLRSFSSVEPSLEDVKLFPLSWSIKRHRISSISKSREIFLQLTISNNKEHFKVLLKCFKYHCSYLLLEFSRCKWTICSRLKKKKQNAYSCMMMVSIFLLSFPFFFMNWCS